MRQVIRGHFFLGFQRNTHSANSSLVCLEGRAWIWLESKAPVSLSEVEEYKVLLLLHHFLYQGRELRAGILTLPEWEETEERSQHGLT